MPRFTISHHDHPDEHWDFFLEHGGELLTWRLAQPMSNRDTIVARKLPNHRSVYLDYSGPLSGNRGTVTRVMTGQFEWRVGDPDAGIIEILLSSDVINGVCVLRHIDADDWECHFQTMSSSSDS